MQINKRIVVLWIIAEMALAGKADNGSYRLCDFHQHTSFSDGRFSMAYDFHKCDSVGLAWWANSEHGGPSQYNGLVSGDDTNTWLEWQQQQVVGDKDLGEDNAGKTIMWRWQTLSQYSYPEIVKMRDVYPNRTILQGLEWNAPGHEHASMAILDHQFDDDGNCGALAEFEYKFDFRDRDLAGGKSRGWDKSRLALHDKFIEAIHWLGERYPNTSWVIPAHPDRKGRWTIADFRQMNDIAPQICFGFEGVPGHQRSADRGEYAPRNNSYGTYTYGGAGLMVAKIGGVWDALLSEGRRWWVFSCSDFHNMQSDFLPGEYNRTYLYMPQRIQPMDIASYLKSGNCFVVGGDFVDNLYFNIGGKTMGETLVANTDSITIDIAIHENEASSVRLDHIDLIEGKVSGLNQTQQYDCDSVATTRVIARFSKADLRKTHNGMLTVTAHVASSYPHAYYRLRATNVAPATPGETDAGGNPLADGPDNTEAKAMNDQWMYSNPIFVTVEHDYSKKTNKKTSR